MPYKLVYKIERKLNNKLSRLKLNSDTGTGKNVQMKHQKTYRKDSIQGTMQGIVNNYLMDFIKAGKMIV